MNKHKTITGKIGSVLEMIIGNLLSAATFGLLIIPQGFASAGVTGLTSRVCGLIPLSLSQTVFVINMLFLVLGYVMIGKEFTAKTIVSSAAFPLLLQVFSVSGECRISSPLLAAVLAGILLGTGTGLLLHSGASSGGFSVLGVLLQKQWKIPAAVTLNITDAAIILLQACGQPLMNTVYGIFVITLSAWIVGRITSADSLAPEFLQRMKGFHLPAAGAVNGH